MKPETIPIARVFGPFAEGPDVRAVKRALWRYGEKGMVIANGKFGDRAQHDLADFKRKHGLLADPIYTEQAHAKLIPFFDTYAARLMTDAAAAIRAQRLRDAFVATRRWMVEHHHLFDYAQIRPWPHWLSPFETTHKIVTDCSGSVELAALWTPGCPDPSRFGFNGEGNTGSLLAGCSRIFSWQARPSDLIVYRAALWDGFGHHVVSIDEKLGGGDFKTVSHGTEGDPNFILHSSMAAYQASRGYPVATFLRFL